MGSATSGSIYLVNATETTISIRFDAVDGVDSYRVFYCVKGESAELSTLAGGTEITLYNLQSGTEYLVQYCGVQNNIDGESSAIFTFATKAADPPSDNWYVHIYDGAHQKWLLAKPYVFEGSESRWVKVRPYIFDNGAWRTV